MDIDREFLKNPEKSKNPQNFKKNPKKLKKFVKNSKKRGLVKFRHF